MNDKCLKNELMDIKTINIPDFSNENESPKDESIYVFAGYIKPGYHQIAIYDPLMQKSFYKDFIVNLNLREDLYPEYPTMEGMKMKKRIRNVFKPWIDDDDERKQ